MPFDPVTRKETWCFLRVKRGKLPVVYHRLPFNYVEFDNDPTRYLEPVPASDFYHLDAFSANIHDPFINGARRVGSFEFMDTPYPFEGLHGF